MFAANPIAPLTAYLSPGLLQGYIVLMAVAVVVGVGFDLVRDGKARFFLQDRRRARAWAARSMGIGELAGIAARTVAVDIATFAEFCNRRRRISHALMFYGFVGYLVASVTLAFCYPTEPWPPLLLPLLWHLGVLAALAGGYWFFFLLRVDVVHDGHPPWRLVRADLFIVCLLASLTFALLFQWAAQTGHALATGACAGLYLLFNTLLFGTVPWSKFAHMFYKPAMAFQRRVEAADGSSSLPAPKGDGRCPHSPT